MFLSVQELMMMRSEQVAGYIRAAPILQHARVVLLICALGVKSADSQIAVAKLALTSLAKLESSMPVLLGFLFYFILFVALTEPHQHGSNLNLSAAPTR